MWKSTLHKAEIVCTPDSQCKEIARLEISRGDRWPGGPYHLEAGSYVYLSVGAKDHSKHPLTPLTAKHYGPMGPPKLSGAWWYVLLGLQWLAELRFV